MAEQAFVDPASIPFPSSGSPEAFVTPTKSPVFEQEDIPSEPAANVTPKPTTESPSLLPSHKARVNVTLPMSWLQSHAARHYACNICQQVAKDPLLLPMTQALACRACVENQAVMPIDTCQEAPPCVASAVRELSELLSAMALQLPEDESTSPNVRSMNGMPPQADASVLSSRRLVKVKRPPVHTSPEKPPQSLGASPEGGPPSHNTSFQHLNPNVPPQTRSAHSMKATSTATPPKASPARQQVASASLVKDEQEERRSIAVEEAKGFTELQKKMAIRHKELRRGSSKQLKIEADERYERADYSAAIDLYTKAIKANDGSTKLPGLFGNRSAALFMCGRFEECIEDCQRSASDETMPNSSATKSKMWQRAAKASVHLGQLQRAVVCLASIEPSKLTEDLRSDKDRFEQGARLLEEAKRDPPEQAEEAWRMLVAEFTDSIPLRHGLAECYMAQRKFEKASDLLARIAPTSQRNATTALLLGKSYYCSGFEHFDKARDILVDYREESKECEALLAMLNQVDDGKQRGNSLFSKREFRGSVDAYTQAINADPSNARILRILYCNRAAANKELGKFSEGVEDCTKALQFDPAFAKAFARRARCHQHLEDYSSAINDFKSAISCEPQDKDLVRELRACETALAREAEREKDHYYVLGVGRNATEAEIKKRYKELVLKYHPDKHASKSDEVIQNAKRKFQLINEAHGVLTNAEKRREYDWKSQLGGGGHDPFRPPSSSSAPYGKYNPDGARHHTHADPSGFGGERPRGSQRFGAGGVPRYTNSGGFF